MIVDIKKNILIVGMGLLGGSYAKGLKKYGFKMVGIDSDEKTVKYALENNIVDEAYSYPCRETIENADIIIFALYPHTFLKWIGENGKYIKEDALLTDVTGIKGSVVYKVQEMLKGRGRFIAAHPMAGREVLGIENSTEDMFKGANYIVTPTGKNTKDDIEECMEIGKLLGFKQVAVLSPEEHDDMIGFVSQLTHIIAVSLMTCNDCEHIEKFTGDSFRDLTRIANINDEMWSELFLANKEPLLNQMKLFENQFNVIRDALNGNDREKLREVMKKSAARRQKFDK